jgi:hypothetical protein
LARIELKAENIIGSYSRPKHEICTNYLSNGAQLNRVFELAGVSHGPQPQLGTEVSMEASKQRKTDAYGREAHQGAGKEEKWAIKDWGNYKTSHILNVNAENGSFFKFCKIGSLF